MNRPMLCAADVVLLIAAMCAVVGIAVAPLEDAEGDVRKLVDCYACFVLAVVVSALMVAVQ